MTRAALRALIGPVVSAALVLGITGAAWAQKTDDPVEKRFQDIEKQLKQLRSIVTQARDTGQPVQVRISTDPDPTLDALTMRVDDLEQAAKVRNDQIDGLTHDLGSARKADADDKAQIKDLEDRLAAAEARIKSLQDAQQQAAATAPPPPGPQGSLGTLPAPPAPPPGNPAEAFKQANKLMNDGDYVAASNAFQSFVDTYGDSPLGPEARYWLGETLLVQEKYNDAAAAYIGALRGYPQASWAPSAMLDLAKALIALNKPTDACHTIDAFVRHYPSAPASAKAKARDIRAAAKCPA